MFYCVAYYPEHWPEEWWARDARLIAECHFDGVRVGEFAWSHMEPEEGRYDFGWLDRAIDTFAREGVKVILGTPTATPPPWLVHKHPEILPVDAMGVRMGSSMRKHYCHTSPVYREYAARIVEELARRYGQHPNVYGWQIDNEFGDHDTVRCYCDACRQGFIDWLQKRYDSTDELNRAWGSVFWSQEYSAWEQIPLPLPRRPIGLNPGHLLDYYRFASDQVIDFARLQTDIIRRHADDAQRITTNIIATFWEIDFQKLAQTLDFIGWDCYTIIDAMSPIRYPHGAPPPPIHYPYRPAMISLVHDLMRSFKHAPFWVLETAGQDRLVTYHTMARGGEGISFFRWRGVRFGAEQSRGGYEYHGIQSPRYIEGQRVGAEMRQIAPEVEGTTFTPSVGLLYSFDMGWAYDIAHVYPRSTWVDGTSYWRVLEEYYTHLWRHNVPVEPLTPNDDLSAYSVIVAPCLYLMNEELADRLCDYVENGGILIVGPASGTKDWNNAYSLEMPPIGRLRELFGCALVGGGGMFVGEAAAVRMADDAPFAAGQIVSAEPQSTAPRGFFRSGRPTEELRAEGADVLAHWGNGKPAGTLNRYGRGEAIYLGWTPNEGFFDALIAWLQQRDRLVSAGRTPAGVEATIREGDGRRLLFLVNHNMAPTAVALEGHYRDLISNEMVSGEVIVEGQAARVLRIVSDD
ncbi:MAG: beta-galactosidase [Anaerolineae bacterium]|jgi:beta-galactosidase